MLCSLLQFFRKDVHGNNLFLKDTDLATNNME